MKDFKCISKFINSLPFFFSQNEHYYVYYAKIKHIEEHLTAKILFSTKDLLNQLNLSHIRFFVINLVEVLVLYLFSWYYTKRLLSPIKKSQEQQAAFIAAASHELRTLLSVILSSITALKCTPPAKQDHFGLGLCIAKEIIVAHHGSIQVNDTPGGGTTFTIKLPRKI